MNYEKDMYIDHTALDVEWLEQANLAMKYGRHWSKCKEEFTRAEENVKIVRAELIAQANEDPDKWLGEGVKPTVSNVEAFYRTHKTHKEAKERWIKAMRELNDAEVAKNEVSFTRKAALEALVQLHGQQYFAGPKMPRNLIDERKTFRKETDRRVRKIRRS